MYNIIYRADIRLCGIIFKNRNYNLADSKKKKVIKDLR